MRKIILLIVLLFSICVYSQQIIEIRDMDKENLYWYNNNIDNIPIYKLENDSWLFNHFTQMIFRADNEEIYPMWFSVNLPKDIILGSELVKHNWSSFSGIWLCNSYRYIYMKETSCMDRGLFQITKEEALNLYTNKVKSDNLQVYMKYIQYELQNKAYTQSYCAYVSNMKFIFYNFDKQDAQKILDSFTIYRWPYKIIRESKK